MRATIFVIREHESIEYHFAVEVTRDADGDIDALVGEDVPEKYWSTRYGGLEIEETGYLKYSEGEDIELTDEEVDEAKQTIADLEKSWADERARLKAIFAPESQRAA